jgi:FdrA protein
VSVHIEARTGAYADSVTLMQVSRRVQDTDGVDAALVAMATELNLDLARGMGFEPPNGVSADALLIAIRARDAATLQTARAAADAALTARPAAGSSGGAAIEAPARTVGSAIRRGGGTLALISVPGPHAFTEAMDALEAGCDVMVFSDNVPIDQEVRLKSVAAELGRLVMGPDCGTAVVGGVGLGFSHTVQPGPVGVVAASGTGCQQLLSLLDAAGVGITAALGVGGRDLSAAVGARSTLTALDILDADPATELIVVVSKPPADEVARAVRAHADTLDSPVQFAFLGETDLTAAAEVAIAELGTPVPTWATWMPEPGRPANPRPGALRGLFCGGTLCDEAMLIAASELGRVRSNIAPLPSDRVGPTERTPEHVLIDFGDDELTAGRPHPMIDQSLRLERFAAEAADQGTAVILLDVVLGHGAHPDPAAELAPLIETSGPPVVVCLIGTTADPQGLEAQAAVLQQAGAHVFASNAQAARFACGLVAS